MEPPLDNPSVAPFNIGMDYQTTIADRWYHFCPGSVLLEQEREQLAKLLTHIFGDYLIQMGGPSDLSLVQDSPISKKIYLGPTPGSYLKTEQVQADLLDLPLIPNSVDVMVLPHILEFSGHPGTVLHQAHQALLPNGQLIIFGFNAWSIWGLQRLLKGKSGFPWSGKFWSIGQIKRWLRAVGFRIVVSKTLFFRPPVSDRDTARRLLYLEPIGQFCFPWFGSAYMITAQKRVPAMTPLKATWWQKKVALTNGYAKPTTRNLRNVE